MTLRHAFALVVLVFFLYVVSPLLLPVAMGGVLAVLAFPVMIALERRKVGRRTAASLVTAGVSFVFLFPISFSLILGARAALQQFAAFRSSGAMSGDGTLLQQLIESPIGAKLIAIASSWYPVDGDELLKGITDLASGVAIKLADWLGRFLAQLPGLFLSLAIAILGMYFLLVDGRRLVVFMRRYSIFEPGQTSELFDTFAGLCRSVILASLLSGLAQALVVSLASLIVGIPNATFLGLLVFVASFIPLVGSAPVTVAIAVHQFVAEGKGYGIAMLVIALVVGLLDNFIRPLVMKGGANLHPLLAFVAAFGGLQLMGFAGLFIGPIVAGLFVATVELAMSGGLEPRRD